MTDARRLLCLGIALLALLGGGCQSRARYLIVTETTHFALHGDGNALNLPLFAGTLDEEKIVRGVTQAEYYYQKLASVYGSKAFTFIADTTVELLLSREGRQNPAQTVYGYSGSQSAPEIALIAFRDNAAEYRVRITDPVTGELHHHTVRIPSGRSASVGLLYDSTANRGYLVAIAVRALALTPSLPPDSLASFLGAKYVPVAGSAEAVFRPGDQRWMDTLFGPRALRLPLAAELAADSIAMDIPPSPVGGMNAFAAHMIYPRTAVNDSLEGRVIVDAIISELGEVTACRVLRSVRADLDSAAVRGVRAVRFTPAQAKGRPLAAHVAIPVAFRLPKK